MTGNQKTLDPDPVDVDDLIVVQQHFFIVDHLLALGQLYQCQLPEDPDWLPTYRCRNYHHLGGEGNGKFLLGVDGQEVSVKPGEVLYVPPKTLCGTKTDSGMIYTEIILKKGLSTLELAMDTPFSLCVTGSNTEALLEQDSAIPSLGDIPAIVEGVRWIIPQVGSVIEIGSQGARFITDLQSRAPQFSVNEHCAGGTGSFFEDQMSRVGCRLGDYSSLVEQAQSVPRLSGRCAVFAKTDIIHRQQEGVSTPDILLGLCYAMIRNYKVTIVRRLPVCKPVVFCGGVTCNAGVIRAIRDVFGLSEEELIVPEFARYEAALGAALKASGSFTLRQLNDSLDRTLTTHHTVGTLPKLELRPGTSLAEPNATEIIPESGCALGIDIGSTSTDLVLVGADGELVDFQYPGTAVGTRL